MILKLPKGTFKGKYNGQNCLTKMFKYKVFKNLLILAVDLPSNVL